jgi:uncharacterized protein (TIGR03663 family)
MIRGLALRFALLAVIFAGALALRVPGLDRRPMHADEAVHAVKFRDLWKKGVYRYDPDEYHGPTLYYASLPAVTLHGRTDFGDLRESDLRMGPAVFGAALILLLALAADGLGWAAVITAAALLASSPAFVFYSRYFIQEILLAFFTLGAIVSGWRMIRSRRPAWAIATGLSVGLMIATKETAVLSLFAALVGLVAARRATGGLGPPRQRSPSGARLWALVVLAALVTSVALLSSFFTNASGPIDYLRSYTPWVGRAHSSELHNQPWYYYLRLLSWSHGPNGPVWSEGLILALAAFGVVASLKPDRFGVAAERKPFLRFVAVYTVVLTAIYCAIPYKTPWNVLGFLTGMALLAGTGASVLLRVFARPSLKWAIAGIMIAAWGHLTWQANLASFVHPTSGGNPYAYAQTVPDVVEMAERTDGLAKAHADVYGMPIEVIASDGYYWPLPWYLRRHSQVGYWTEIPQEKPLPIVIASADLDEALDARLRQSHVMTGFFGLRSGVLYQMWVRLDLWEEYLKTHRPPAD